MKAYTDLTQGEKIVIRRKVADQLLQANGPGTTSSPGLAPTWLSAELQATWNALADKCRRAELSQWFFVYMLGKDQSLVDAYTAEALARAQAMVFLDSPGAAWPSPPVTGENVAGLG